MVPTLLDGDIMILDKIGYRINGLKRFDIVVIKYNNEKIIKRVIGLPGDYIEYKDNILYVNGKEIKEALSDKEQIENLKQKMNKKTTVISMQSVVENAINT